MDIINPKQPKFI